MPETKKNLTEDQSLYEELPKKDEDKDKTQMTDGIYDTIQAQNMGDGLLTLPDEDLELDEDVAAEYTVGKDFETYGKYTEEILQDIIKNPSKYKMKSKKHGEMNLKEALDKGYNPDTDEFDKEPIKSKEELTKDLSDSDKEAIDKMTSPEAAQIPPEDAKALGVEDERFIKKANQQAEAVPEAPTEGGEDILPEGGDGGDDGMAALMAMMGG